MRHHLWSSSAVVALLFRARRMLEQFRERESVHSPATGRRIGYRDGANGNRSTTARASGRLRQTRRDSGPRVVHGRLEKRRARDTVRRTTATTSANAAKV
jgi:hypothetical protein